MIRFGTSGWRAVFADEFTFLNVRRVAHTLSGYVKENPEFGANSPEFVASLDGTPKSPVPVVVIGYDTRFQSEEFAQEAAGVFAQDGVKTILADSDAPTPAVGWTVIDRKAVGGLMVTASHNSASYNGIKWMPYWGGAASPAITNDLERRIELSGHVAVKIMALDRSLRESWIESADIKAGYFKQLTRLLDAKAIKKAKLKVAVDSMHGAARGYLRPFLESLGAEVHGLHEERDPLFGGKTPEPAPESLGEMAALMKSKRLGLGLACDGDADRFGVLDAGGEWISANDALGLVLEHLVVNRGLRGKVARSVMTSHFVDAVAKSHGLEVRETPVGFKYIGELLRSGAFLLGGEESGGLSIRGHVPDKDGLLACLLLAELVAIEKKPLAAIRDRVFKRVGCFVNERLNYRMEGLRDTLALQERLKVRPPLDLAGASVWRIDDSDGFKFILRDGSWLGLRPSGTEPVFRVYAEASSPKRLEAIVESGKKLLQGKI